MADYILPLQKLIEQFRKLPGIGSKTAARLAFSVLDLSESEAEEFADAVIGAKKNIRKCSVCCNFSENELCPICSDDRRDKSVICVVEDARDVFAFEKVREFNGTYHILGGALSPMNGIGPDSLNIKELLARLGDGTVEEVIVATNPTVEGEATAMYLARLIAPLGIRVTRLAYGVPVGGELEYADEVTLHRAIEGRQNLV